MTNDKILCLVYGTLRDDNKNRRIVHVKGKMRNLGGFPAVMLDEKRFDGEPDIIECEILEVHVDDYKTQSRLDRIEGVPHLYTVEEVTTIEGDECVVYQGNSAWSNSDIINPDEDGVVRWRGGQSNYGGFDDYESYLKGDVIG